MGRNAQRRRGHDHNGIRRRTVVKVPRSEAVDEYRCRLLEGFDEFLGTGHWMPDIPVSEETDLVQMRCGECGTSFVTVCVCGSAERIVEEGSFCICTARYVFCCWCGECLVDIGDFEIHSLDG